MWYADSNIIRENQLFVQESSIPFRCLPNSFLLKSSSTGSVTLLMDPDLLGSLIDRHAAALVLYARQWCFAEDVVQVAFVKLAQQATLPAQPAAWLYRAVRNGAISQYRSDRRRQKYENLAAELVPLWFEPAEDPTGLDAGTATTYLAQLPLEQREAIVAHLWGGLTFEQIADLVASSPATVWRRYNAGLAALRERMTLPCPNFPTK